MSSSVAGPPGSDDGADAPRTLARAFVAVVPPEPVLDALDVRLEAARALNAPLRWVRREQWHVTLQFLGWVKDADALIDGLGVAAARLAGSPVLGPVALAGAGAFPDERRGTVLWVGAGAGAGVLATLARRVAEVTKALGIRGEDRPFQAHLTVGRAPKPRDLRAAVAALGTEPIGPAWTPAALHLVVSETRRDGARHTEVGRFPLVAVQGNSSSETPEGS